MPLACWLEGPGSSHAKTGAAVAWARAHKIFGTVYVGNPKIGFRKLSGFGNWTGLGDLLRRDLADARALLAGSATR